MNRYCPICNEYSDKFGPMGIIPREDAMCLNCKSLERHRLIWLYISKYTDFLKDSNKKLLHIAPEKTFQNLFQKHLKENYISGDLYDRNAMMEIDITNIPFKDESFDYIYCSHVLEHVIDDKKAMKEFYRIMRPNGWAILLVPIMKKGKTFEDFSITEPSERQKVYGDPYHVRNYGTDYKDRLIESGFKVNVIYPKDFLSKKETIQMGITSAAGEIYFCTK